MADSSVSEMMPVARQMAISSLAQETMLSGRIFFSAAA